MAVIAISEQARNYKNDLEERLEELWTSRLEPRPPLSPRLIDNSQR